MSEFKMTVRTVVVKTTTVDDKNKTTTTTETTTTTSGGADKEAEDLLACASDFYKMFDKIFSAAFGGKKP